MTLESIVPKFKGLVSVLKSKQEILDENAWFINS